MGLVRAAIESAFDGSAWDVVFANDNDPRKHAIYHAFYNGDSHLNEGSFLDLRPGQIPEADLWTASFPCTDLSLAGAREGLFGSRSGVVWHLFRLLRATPRVKRPRAILFENVMGLLSSNAGDDIRLLCEEISRYGYAIDLLRVDAAHFTPQSRPRLFIVAKTRELVDLADPGSVATSSLRPAAITTVMKAYPTIPWFESTQSVLPSRESCLEDILDDSDKVSHLWWAGERRKHFVDQIHPRHRPRLAEATRGSSRSQYFPAFRRVRSIDGERKCLAELRFDGMAGCLRTPKGGSAKQILVEAIKSTIQPRHFTATECMKLQGCNFAVPEHLPEDDMLFGLGDAVCVPAVKWVLEHAVGHA